MFHSVIKENIICDFIGSLQNLLHTSLLMKMIDGFTVQWTCVRHWGTKQEEAVLLSAGGSTLGYFTRVHSFSTTVKFTPIHFEALRIIKPYLSILLYSFQCGSKCLNKWVVIATLNIICHIAEHFYNIRFFTLKQRKNTIHRCIDTVVKTDSHSVNKNMPCTRRNQESPQSLLTDRFI